MNFRCISALALSKSSLVGKRSTHMNLRLHMVRDFQKQLCYCPTGDNKADLLTKPVTSDLYLGIFDTRPVDVDDEPGADGFVAKVCFLIAV